MKYNPKLQNQISGYLNYPIIVEGKKDVLSLNELGFQRVYAIHETGIPLKIKLEELSKIIPKKEKVCILTDFDKKGKLLYFKIKQICSELGIKTDSTLRGLILLANISHIEGLHTFIKKSNSY